MSVKKSANVAAPLLASVALAFLAGCRSKEMKRCVDEHNTVVDDSLCRAQQQQQQPQPGVGFYPYPFRWYYGGWGGYSRGSAVGGGGFVAAPGHSYASPTSRGGFGSTFSGGAGE
ncbi:MAG TPA: hypothetical protein VF865_06840 [Acidobacteriaceae bacterium]